MDFEAKECKMKRYDLDMFLLYLRFTFEKERLLVIDSKMGEFGGIYEKK